MIPPSGGSSDEMETPFSMATQQAAERMILQLGRTVSGRGSSGEALNKTELSKAIAGKRAVCIWLEKNTRDCGQSSPIKRGYKRVRTASKDCAKYWGIVQRLKSFRVDDKKVDSLYIHDEQGGYCVTSTSS